MFCNNSSNLNTTIPYVTNARDILWTFAFALEFSCGIIGNLLILWIIYRDNRLKTTTNFLIANMAISDVLSALVNFPVMIMNINYCKGWLGSGDMISIVTCKLFYFLMDECFQVSIGSCVFIAIDRYFAVVKPFKKPFENNMKYIISGIWIFTVAVSAPNLYYFGLTYIFGDQLHCTVVSQENLPSYKIYRYIVILLNTGLAAPFIMIIYTLTVRKLYRHKAPGLSQSALKRRQHQNKKILKMSVTIVLFLYLSHGTWLVYVILLFQGVFPIVLSTSFRNFVFSCFFIIYFGSMFNFFIYIIFNDIYRQNLKTMICKYCRVQMNSESREMEPARRSVTVSEWFEMMTLFPFNYLQTNHSLNSVPTA